MEVKRNDHSNLLGAKFYAPHSDENDILRVVGFANNNTVKVWDTKNNKGKKINIDDLLDNYILLNPNGTILFAIVDMPGDIKDVVVSLFKLPNNDGIPYCVCRQNMIDFHNQMINPQKMIVGCCITEETTPEGIDMKMVRACNGLDYSIAVSVYLNDKLDDILKCVGNKVLSKFDIALQTLFDSNVEKLQIEYLKKEARESNIYGGYCRTLKDLLIDNEFMYDFRRCFGVSSFPILHRFPTELLVSDDERMDNLKQDFHSVDECYIDQLSKEYGFWLNNAQAIIYDHDIDLNELEHGDKDFVLICAGKEETIFLVIYEKGNKYIQETPMMSPVDKLKNIVDSTKN